jgi:hypothetical protein
VKLPLEKERQEPRNSASPARPARDYLEEMMPLVANPSAPCVSLQQRSADG